MKRKFIAIWMLILVLLFVSGCDEESEYSITKSGYLLTPGILAEVNAPNASFYYMVLDEEPYNYEEVKTTAEKIVKEWWNDDTTLVHPVEIIPMECTSTRAFETDGYIFLDFNASDALASLVHEYIHLQNEEALIYADETGREVMEMVVETITINLVGENDSGIPTDNYKFFINCPKLYEKFIMLEKAFKEKSSAEETYRSLFGENAYEIVSKLDNYSSLPMAFDNKMEYEDFLNNILGVTEKEFIEIYNEF